MVTLPRAEAQVQNRNCAESALIIHVYFTHCASARARALKKNKVRLGIHLRREWDCMLVLGQICTQIFMLGTLNRAKYLLRSVSK